MNEEETKELLYKMLKEIGKQTTMQDWIKKADIVLENNKWNLPF